MMRSAPYFCFPQGGEPAQRCSSGCWSRILRLLLWGEPLGRLALIPRLTEALCAVSGDWPPSDYWIGERVKDPTTSWIANLYPAASDLRASLRDWFLRWLGVPAKERGFGRWGLKEVRLGAAEACVLRWLFPKANFLVLLRHPLDAYRSASQVKLWYRWPDWPIDCAAAFARHWDRLARSWLGAPNDLAQITIRYEDLVSRHVDFGLLERALELKLDPDKALSARVGSSMNLQSPSWYERRILLKETRQGRQAYGYSDRAHLEMG